MNFLPADAAADYVNTGEWSDRAIREAARFGRVAEAASSAASRFSHIPKSLSLTPNARYLHITTNNTIEGTQWPSLPDSGGAPLIADASSDFLARSLDYSQFALAYAGAQKNAGPAGVTLVVARKTFLDTASGDVPDMLSYKVHERYDSLYNTPPAFAVYIVGLVLRWIESEGGILAMESRSRRKAAVVYEALDQSLEAFDPTVTDVADRSLMNITFRLRDPSRETEFLAGAEERAMIGLKGHRSVGGFRASLYNALPLEGACALADYLLEFARR
jgi:phosphoserine aminotransferase